MIAPAVGSASPWGAVESAHEVAEGIVWMTTASHGGAWLSRARWEEMPAALRAVTPFAHLRGGYDRSVTRPSWQGPTEQGAWYEEDEDATLVVLAFPTFHDPQTVWTVVEGMGSHWSRGDVRTAVRAWMGDRDASAAARGVAEAWGRDHASWWIPAGSASSEGEGWRAWFQQVGTGDRALRYLTADEYLDMDGYRAVPELPGVPAGRTRVAGRAS